MSLNLPLPAFLRPRRIATAQTYNGDDQTSYESCTFGTDSALSVRRSQIVSSCAVSLQLGSAQRATSRKPASSCAVKPGSAVSPSHSPTTHTHSPLDKQGSILETPTKPYKLRQVQTEGSTARPPC